MRNPMFKRVVGVSVVYLIVAGLIYGLYLIVV